MWAQIYRNQPSLPHGQFRSSFKTVYLVREARHCVTMLLTKLQKYLLTYSPQEFYWVLLHLLCRMPIAVFLITMSKLTEKTVYFLLKIISYTSWKILLKLSNSIYMLKMRQFKSGTWRAWLQCQLLPKKVIRRQTRNNLDCDQSNYSSRIIPSYILAKLLSVSWKWIG